MKTNGTVTKKLAIRRGSRGKKVAPGLAPTSPPAGRVPRITKLMTLAIKFDQLLRDGVVKDQAELARLGFVTRARVTQIMNLLNLAPAVQQALLTIKPTFSGKDELTERQVRRVVDLIDWRDQQAEWKVLLGASAQRFNLPTALMFGQHATSSIIFWLLVAAAGVVCAVTGDLTAIALVPYFWIAWHVAETAFWLRAQDPNRQRGATCFWIYLAYAGTAAAFKALALLLAFILVANWTGWMPPIQTLTHILIVMIGGWMFSCVIGWIGVVLSLSRRIPVYVIPNLKRLCGGEFSNLGSFWIPNYRFNGAVIIVTSAFAAPFMSLSIGLLLYGARFQGDLGRKFAQAGFASMLVSVVALVAAVGFVSRRVAASSPAETWPEYLTLYKSKQEWDQLA